MNTATESEKNASAPEVPQSKTRMFCRVYKKGPQPANWPDPLSARWASA
jgi:hypothetical protein